MKGHIRRRGVETWELKFDIGRDQTGKRITQYCNFKGTKREAQNKLAELISAVDKGTHVARSSVTVAAHVTERIDKWVALEKITPKTAERYRELAENQIGPHIGGIKLQELKAVHIEDWHATLRSSGRRDGKGGLSALTVRHCHRLLSKALKEAARHDLVVRNVASMQQPPKVAKKEVEILTADQVRNVVLKLSAQTIYPRAIIALFTGLRRGEILALRWQHVDLDRKVIEVRWAIEETKERGLRFKAPKTENGRRDVTMPDIVVNTLRAYRRQQLEQRLALGLGKLTGDVLLFTRLNGEPRSPHRFSKEWNAAAGELGIKVGLHALRHTHASALIDRGIDVVKICKRLGHASPTVTLEVYAHLFDRREDKSAEAINEAVETLLPP
jgi:integrase